MNVDKCTRTNFIGREYYYIILDILGKYEAKH